MSKNEKIRFIGTQSTYEAREKRFNDAVNLIKPDRVPIVSLAALFFGKYSGLTNAETLYDYDKMAKAWKQSMQRLNWDMSPLHTNIFSGPVMELMETKTFRWAGYNLGDNVGYQYVEREYMMSDEYDELLADPSGFVIHKTMPRMASVLEPLAMLPHLLFFAHSYSVFATLPIFAGMPGFPEMMETLTKVGQEMNRYNIAQAQLAQDLAYLGYPCVTGGGVSFTAFDWLSCFLRGMKGTMLDMYRQPDKVKAAIELLTPYTIEHAVATSQPSGNPRILIPLWRGAAHFMSDKQFAEFYWPSLKQLLLGVINQGLTPIPWFEGDYTPRLKYLAELPPGKVAGHFDIIDRKEAKKFLKDVMCFWGDIPPRMLITSKPMQVKDYVKELIDFFSDTGGLIVDGAVEGVPSDSRPENVEAMTEAVFEFGIY
jgi:uroporphyrinogen-III decarboxylase